MISNILRRFALFLAVAVMLAACGNAGAPAVQSTPASGIAGSPPTEQPATAAPTASRATASVAALPATPAAPTVLSQPSPAAAAGAIPEGRTAEGYHFLGRADAPATLEMYSDFL
jgi:hypothetical protein